MSVKIIPLLFAIINLLFFTACESKKQTENKPNIVIIMADDLGWADVGFNGSADIPTPHIDRLAKSGVRFTNGYVTGPVCGPSRAGLITGRYQSTFGWYGNPNPILAPDQGLPPGIPTIAGYMKELGYKTCGIGKWHMGTSLDRHPNNMGYDEWYGFLSGGSAYFPLWHSYYGYLWEKLKKPWSEKWINRSMPILHNMDPVDHQQYLTREFTDFGVEYIKKHKDEPFFLYLAYNAPHIPLEVPEETLKDFPEKNMRKLPNITPKTRSVYGAMISELDMGIGKVLHALDSLDLRENTLVWFLSDNGGSRKTGCNLPLRGFKGTNYEGGIRVPFVLSWPGKVKSNSLLHEPVITLDIGTTAIALSGGNINELNLHGKDLSRYITRKVNKIERDALYWRTGRTIQNGAIREKDYKLIIKEHKVELYNLKNDLLETTDLANEEPELVLYLHKKWLEWDKSSKAPLWEPVPRSEWHKDKYQYSNYPWLKGSHHFREN